MGYEFNVNSPKQLGEALFDKLGLPPRKKNARGYSTDAATLESLGLLFPFLLAAILKTAQGSSTVAITTSAGIIAPLLMTLGFATPLDAALVVVAIGAGAMTVSHANDSYFWVVTNFGEMEPQDGYKTQTLGTLIIGIASIINVLIVSAIF